MNTLSARYDLLQNCKDREYREAFSLENVYATICAQLRVLREQRELSQKQLGRIADMAQERISILEDPNSETKPTLNTLLRLASAFDVGLDVRFVPFSKVIDRSVYTDQKLLAVASFDTECPALEERFARESTSGASYNIYSILGGVVRNVGTAATTRPQRSELTMGAINESVGGGSPHEHAQTVAYDKPPRQAIFSMNPLREVSPQATKAASR